jgi:hypothetical protein
MVLALLFACTPATKSDDTGRADTDSVATDSADSGDSGDSGDSADSGDTADSGTPCTTDSWFADADADGYGTGPATEACEPPPGFVADDGDCDDADPLVHPGAPELCNGLDDDCNGGTGEDGTVSLESEAGWSDETARFAAGTEGSPAHLLLDPGTWHVCPGTWYVALEVTDATVMDGSDAETTILDAGSATSVVYAHGAGAVLDLGDVTLRGGLGDTPSSLRYVAGGGLGCVEGATVTLHDATLAGNRAEVGGALFVEDCALTATNVLVTDNDALYGGGMYATEGSAAFTGSVVTGNTAEFSAGGLGAEGAYFPVFLDLVDTVVSANQAAFGGGLAVYEDATVTCTGSVATVAGMVENVADLGGGMYITGADFNPSFTADLCDFGVDASDNRPDDVNNGEHAETWGDDATFTCDTTGCR